MGGGEGFGLRLGLSGSCAGSRCVAGGVVSQAPIRRRAGVRAAAMTMWDRAAQSDDRARRWRRLMPQERTCPGLGDPSRLHGRGGAFESAAACRSLSRCQARVSSLREIAIVAIFFPRRFAMLE